MSDQEPKTLALEIVNDIQSLTSELMSIDEAERIVSEDFDTTNSAELGRNLLAHLRVNAPKENK